MYLNLTARNDWFSTLNPSSNNYLYPSASVSYIFTQSFGNVPGWLNYGKIRASYAEVGGDTDPYSNNLYYSVNANQFNGVALGSISSAVSPNPNLRPLKVKEAEFGLEVRTMDSRVNLDMSVYKKNTIDEILSVDISNASGYSQTLVNVGKLENKGLEALADGGSRSKRQTSPGKPVSTQATISAKLSHWPADNRSLMWVQVNSSDGYRKKWVNLLLH